MKALRKLLKYGAVTISLLSATALLFSYLSTLISPVDAPLLAFFGLGYPIIVVFNLLLLLLWAIKKSRVALLIGAIILIGIPVHLRFYQINSPEEVPEGKKSLRVMSYNVELFGWYHWKNNIERRNNVFNQLEQYPADIYCFQEFYYTNIPGRFETRDSLVQLLNAPHYHDHYTHEMHEVQFYGIATLSKYPIVNKGVIEFPNDKNNICIFTDILVGEDIFRVYNSHLCSIRFSEDDHQYAAELQADPGQVTRSRVMQIYHRLKNAFEKRSWQAELVRDHIKTSPYPVILCGDFNDTPVSYAYAVFNELLQDTFRSRGTGTGKTYIGNFPSFRIDYIFTSEGFGHAKHNVLPEELSDHRAVWSEIYY